MAVLITNRIFTARGVQNSEIITININVFFFIDILLNIQFRQNINVDRA